MAHPVVLRYLSYSTMFAEHVSGVKCQVSFFGQRGGASQWRVCYQGGLSSLVLEVTSNLALKIADLLY